MDVADQLKTKGRVSRGWLGVLIQDVTLDLAESFGMKQPRGALVAKVLPDSPALAAGIRVGDVIVSFNGTDVVNSSSLPPIVGSSAVGMQIPVEVIRDGRKQELKVQLGELPDEGEVAKADKPAVEQTDRLGISVVDLDDEQRAELEVDRGVLVQNVISGPASRAGIRKGDIILSIDNKPVRDQQQFAEVVNGLAAGKSVALLVQRGGSPTFLAVKVPDAD